MKLLINFLSWAFNDVLGAVILAISGGALAIWFKRDEITLSTAIATLLAAIVMVVFAGPGVCEYFSMAEKLCDTVKVLMAISAMSIVKGVITIGEIFGSNPMFFISKFKHTKNDEENKG